MHDNHKKGKYIGVGYIKQYGYYIARIRYDGKTRRIGSFKNEIDAALAYDREARLHLPDARFNFPEPEPDNQIPNTRLIRLTKGLFAIVDSEDYERVNKFKWHAEKADNTYYGTRTIKINGKRSSSSIHRFILGVTDPNIQVDHKDRNGLNCQKNNLRLANNQQNSINQVGCNKTSKYKGVYYNKEKRMYSAQIKLNYKSRHIGYFRSEIEAAMAYDERAKQEFGEFAYLNFK